MDEEIVRYRLMKDEAVPGLRPSSSEAAIFRVINAGAIPSGPLKYYACHAVNLSGEETEGTAVGFSEGSDVVVVAVVRGSPAVGDYLVGRRAGNRWAGESSRPAITLTGIVAGCGVNNRLAGVTVTLTQGSFSVSATSDASGVVTFSLPSTGTYHASQVGAPVGYAAAMSDVTGIVAGPNSRNLIALADAANGYFCDGCTTPVTALHATVTQPGRTDSVTLTLVPGVGVVSEYFPLVGFLVTLWGRLGGVPDPDGPNFTPFPPVGIGIRDSGVLASDPMPPPTFHDIDFAPWTRKTAGQCVPYSATYSSDTKSATYTH